MAIDLLKKWEAVLNEEFSPKITDSYKRHVTAQLLENQLQDMKQSKGVIDPLVEDTPAVNASGVQNTIYGAVDNGAVPSDGVGNGYMAGYDPVLIKLVRRAMPQLMAFDVCGVQPMTQPTGLIFALKARYQNQQGKEALYNEADSTWSSPRAKRHDKEQGATTAFPAVGENDERGSNWADAIKPNLDKDGYPVISTGLYDSSVGTQTYEAESDDKWNQMAMSIERTSVIAKSRYLKAEYTMELAQDLKSVHGLDAASELSNILATEIVSEINREVIRDIYLTAQWGCADTHQKGVFDMDLDSGGRWSAEKFKGLMFRIEREANAVGHMTRRGRANFIICSSDVASALQMAGALEYAPAIQNNLRVDDTTTTFAGILNGKYKVYIDPYTGNFGTDQYVVVGYKGDSPYDAGMFYCPYVPLQLVRAVDPNSFQPKIGFKTRYGIAFNPMVQLDAKIKSAEGATVDSLIGKNYFYRKFLVRNLG